MSLSTDGQHLQTLWQLWQLVYRPYISKHLRVAIAITYRLRRLGSKGGGWTPEIYGHRLILTKRGLNETQLLSWNAWASTTCVYVPQRRDVQWRVLSLFLFRASPPFVRILGASNYTHRKRSWFLLISMELANANLQSVSCRYTETVWIIVAMLIRKYMNGCKVR